MIGHFLDRVLDAYLGSGDQTKNTWRGVLVNCQQAAPVDPPEAFPTQSPEECVRPCLIESAVP